MTSVFADGVFYSFTVFGVKPAKIFTVDVPLFIDSAALVDNLLF